ncbi:MAG: RNA-dependent ATPase rok1 [Alyxoria varia]|nr:MAG: RNA-dependent ATPase rok1 [Alyxoria varia]
MSAFSLLSRSTRIRPSDSRSTISLGSNDPNTLQSGPCLHEQRNGIEAVIEQQRGDKIGEDSETLEGSYTHDAEKCKQILKAHKLKVSQLVPSSHDISRDSIEPKNKKRKTPTLEREGREKKRRRTEIIPQPLTSFASLKTRYNLPQPLLANVDAQGYTLPTEVQFAALPMLLGQSKDHVEARGESKEFYSTVWTPPVPSCYCDLLTIAPTGSGKTLAFLVPLIASALQKQTMEGPHRKTPRAIIIAPTKELSKQIMNEARRLTFNTSLRTVVVQKDFRFDQSSRPNSKNKVSLPFEDAADILVSTPGAMVHAIEKSTNRDECLLQVQNLVLDEADVLLDPLFRDQTLKICNLCSNPNLRISFWSATMGSSIEETATSLIEDRRKSLANDMERPPPQPQLARIVVGLKDSAIPNISHKMIYAASERGKLMALRDLIDPRAASGQENISLRPPFLVFAQTIPRAIALHSELLYDIPQDAGGPPRLAVMHGDLSDYGRDQIMTRFRKGDIWVLITTDLLARGVDFRGINGVVNYDLPTSSAAYVHRVGRTGRAGREGGVAVTLYAKEDLAYVKNIANVIAASEGQRPARVGEGEVTDHQRWLLESLPKLSKQDKKQIKTKGVASRRTRNFAVKGDAHVDRKTRISTKSGYEKGREDRKKGARKVSRSKATRAESSDGSEFEGFEA